MNDWIWLGIFYYMKVYQLRVLLNIIIIKYNNHHIWVLTNRFLWREDLRKSKDRTDHFQTGSGTKLTLTSSITPKEDTGEEQN